MAVLALVFVRAKGLNRNVPALATPARVRWAIQRLVVSLSCRKVALCALKELCQTGALTNGRRSPPPTIEEASHASLKSARRLRDEKPGDLCSPAQAAALCTACAHNWAASRRIALTNTHRGAQQSHRSRDSRVQPPKHQSQGLPEHRTR